MLRAGKDLAVIFSGDVERSTLLSLRKQLKSIAGMTAAPDLITREDMGKGLGMVGMGDKGSKTKQHTFLFVR
jgi:hypothetical protein